jgi:ubiquinone/menaquinone biosynthesis C-methylase UbiE
MNTSVDWKQVWEERSKAAASDFQLDRGRSPHDDETEQMSEKLLINFIEPNTSEIVLDAGCGTGVNILRLHSRVAELIGMDYSSGSLGRCEKRLREQAIKNARVHVGSVTAIALPDCCVDKVLCMSVLQYLDEREVYQAFGEFIRVLRPGGVIVLHVKNLSSLYWSTLWPAKKMTAYLKGRGKIEYVRQFKWYVRKLAALGCIVLDYDSFNLLTIDVMPEKVVSSLRGFEIRHHNGRFFGNMFVRRHGAELMIKARTPA